MNLSYKTYIFIHVYIITYSSIIYFCQFALYFRFLSIYKRNENPLVDFLWKAWTPHFPVCSINHTKFPWSEVHKCWVLNYAYFILISHDLPWRELAQIICLNFPKLVRSIDWLLEIYLQEVPINHLDEFHFKIYNQFTNKIMKEDANW